MTTSVNGINEITHKGDASINSIIMQCLLKSTGRGTGYPLSNKAWIEKIYKESYRSFGCMVFFASILIFYLGVMITLHIYCLFFFLSQVLHHVRKINISGFILKLACICS